MSARFDPTDLAPPYAAGERPLDEVLAEHTAPAPEHCFACGRRLVPADPSPDCRTCWDARHGEPT